MMQEESRKAPQSPNDTIMNNRGNGNDQFSEISDIHPQSEIRFQQKLSEIQAERDILRKQNAELQQASLYSTQQAEKDSLYAQIKQLSEQLTDVIEERNTLRDELDYCRLVIQNQNVLKKDNEILTKSLQGINPLQKGSITRQDDTSRLAKVEAKLKRKQILYIKEEARHEEVIRRLSSKIKKLDQKYRNQKSSLDQALIDISKKDASINELEKRLSDALEELENTNQNSIKVQKLENELSSKEDEIKRLIAEKTLIESKRASITVTDSLVDELAQLQRKIKSQEDTIIQLETQRDDLHEENEQLRNQPNTPAVVDSLRARIEQLEHDKETTSADASELKDLREENEALKNSLKSIVEENASLRAEKKELEQELVDNSIAEELLTERRELKKENEELHNLVDALQKQLKGDDQPLLAEKSKDHPIQFDRSLFTDIPKHEEDDVFNIEEDLPESIETDEIKFTDDGFEIVPMEDDESDNNENQRYQQLNDEEEDDSFGIIPEGEKIEIIEEEDLPEQLPRSNSVRLDDDSEQDQEIESLEETVRNLTINNVSLSEESKILQDRNSELESKLIEKEKTIISLQENHQADSLNLKELRDKLEKAEKLNQQLARDFNIQLEKIRNNEDRSADDIDIANRKAQQMTTLVADLTRRRNELSTENQHLKQELEQAQSKLSNAMFRATLKDEMYKQLQDKAKEFEKRIASLEVENRRLVGENSK